MSLSTTTSKTECKYLSVYLGISSHLHNTTHHRQLLLFASTQLVWVTWRLICYSWLRIFQLLQLTTHTHISTVPVDYTAQFSTALVDYAFFNCASRLRSSHIDFREWVKYLWNKFPPVALLGHFRILSYLNRVNMFSLWTPSYFAKVLKQSQRTNNNQNLVKLENCFKHF